jgi:hypothetical protein
MDPDRRTILQVELNDAVAADAIFSVLMVTRWNQESVYREKRPLCAQFGHLSGLFHVKQSNLPTKGEENGSGKTGRLITVDIENEMKKSYLDYSMSVIVGARPSGCRDGLKPVHRRILYTLLKTALRPTRHTANAPIPSDRFSAAIIPTATQAFTTPGPTGSGLLHALPPDRRTWHFGSIDGDPPAAYRIPRRA